MNFPLAVEDFLDEIESAIELYWNLSFVHSRHSQNEEDLSYQNYAIGTNLAPLDFIFRYCKPPSPARYSI